MNSISDCDIFAIILLLFCFTSINNLLKAFLSGINTFLWLWTAGNVWYWLVNQELKLLNYNVNNYDFHLVILLDGKKTNYIHISLFIITIIKLILIQILPWNLFNCISIVKDINFIFIFNIQYLDIKVRIAFL